MITLSDLIEKMDRLQMLQNWQTCHRENCDALMGLCDCDWTMYLEDELLRLKSLEIQTVEHSED